MLATQHDICGCRRATPVYDFCVLVFGPSYPGLVLSVRDVEFSSGRRCPEVIFFFKVLGWTPEREAPGNHRQHTRIGTAGGGRRKRLKSSDPMGGERGGGLLPTKEYKRVGVPESLSPEKGRLEEYLIYIIQIPTLLSSVYSPPCIWTPMCTFFMLSCCFQKHHKFQRFF